ncbi:hypothetical protein F3I18_18980 [Pantoea sp. B_10]|nr:hypothetical protein F3I18_18980 [Pantoea sp. B_10]
MKTLLRQTLLATLVITAAGTAFAATPASHDYAADFSHVQQINAGVLNTGYVDIGPRDGQAVILLHGWPYDIQSYAQVAVGNAGYHGGRHRVCRHPGLTRLRC